MDGTKRGLRVVLMIGNNVVRQGQRGFGMVLGMMLLVIGVGGQGCGENPPATEEPIATSTSAAWTPAALRFQDVTETAGIHFQHEAGAGTGHKWYPETMGAGAGFVDYDGDGFDDVLLVNGRQWPTGAACS